MACKAIYTRIPNPHSTQTRRIEGLLSKSERKALLEIKLWNEKERERKKGICVNIIP